MYLTTDYGIICHWIAMYRVLSMISTCFGGKSLGRSKNFASDMVLAPSE